MYGDKPNQIFFSYLQTKTYMHEHKFFTPLNKENMHIKISNSSQFFSPFLSIINKGVKAKQIKTNFLPLFVRNKEPKKG